MTAPNPDGSGAGKAILQAIEEAGVAPSEVDYVNAHGTGTPAKRIQLKQLQFVMR